MNPSRSLRPLLLYGLPLLVLVALLAVLLQRVSALRQAAPMAQRDWVGSQVCQTCHEDRHASWHRTFHRSMTQEATAQTVLGRFDGQVLEADGLRLRPVRHGEQFAFEYLDADDQPTGQAAIVRTVGSHRYQQYLSRVQGNDYRLEFLWHVGDQRWVPLNAAFLYPDGQLPHHSVALWNQNCIYCHNTGPQPRIQNYAELAQMARAGVAVDLNRDARYASTVAELGIGCEACHGPGSVHLERSAGWLDRLLLRSWPGSDAAIVQPERLDALRSSQVCAQCHAQRLPVDGRTMMTWLDTGPGYRAGEDLDLHVRVVRQHTASPDPQQPDLYRLRFWGDGSPRLSAYEWQGMSQSACFTGGELSCLNCHAMHAGDPAGMITERQRTDAPCLACHQELRSQLAEHTRHAADSPGARCQNCHMPYQVYGVMSIQRSHDISTPELSRDLASGAPSACSGCHVERSPLWVQQQLQKLWGSSLDPLPERSDQAGLHYADALAGLLAGDAAQQAVWAQRIGTADSGRPAAARAVLIPALLEAMDTRYPSTRRFAWHSVRRLAAELGADDWLARIEQFDFAAAESARAAWLQDIRNGWQALDKSRWPVPDAASHCVDAHWQTDAACLAGLRALGERSQQQISIGE